MDRLSPFLFAVFLNDLEQFMEDKNITGLESISSELEAQLEIYLKIFALLYADDTVLMSETSDGLQTLLNNFYEYSKLWKRHNLSIECLLDLFDKIVKPIFLYGCEVWGFSDNYVLEKN